MPLTEHTERAYRRWRQLAERGYGDTTNITDMRRIDERIRRAKAKYERLLAADKASEQAMAAKAATPAAPRPDVLVENHGTIFMFTPMTPAARAWVEEHVQLESWQWLGGSFSVEHRFAQNLAQGMMADGLEVQ